MAVNPDLVSTQWLEDHLTAPDLVVVDASWYLPTQNRDAKAEYAAGHIPGAVHLDIDQVSDHDDPLPHMLPRPEVFGRAVGAMGIGDGMRMVVYDGLGLFSAPRVWWMLRAFGARDVAVLEGGAPKWRAEGRPWTDEPPRRRPATFTPRFDHGAVASREDIARMLQSGSHQVVDARAADRFRGEAPEPRPGLKAGHMPGSLNVPWSEVQSNGSLRAPDDIRAAFAKAGVDLQKPIVTTCGSGVSAAILTLALNSAGVPTRTVYDGSWAEWGGRDDCPVETGDARTR
jgi:thiosulfate/3-mercaptopyruvate sulfurtransferase